MVEALNSVVVEDFVFTWFYIEFGLWSVRTIEISSLLRAGDRFVHTGYILSEGACLRNMYEALLNSSCLDTHGYHYNTLAIRSGRPRGRFRDTERHSWSKRPHLEAVRISECRATAWKQRTGEDPS